MSTSKESKPVSANESAASGAAPKKKNSSAFLYDDLSFGAKEAFKRLRTNAICSFDDDRSHIIGTTSSQPSEGKSLISINFACCIAELGKKVALVDLDFFRPSVYRKLGLKNDIGISDILTGRCDGASAIQKYTGKAGKFTLDVITSGSGIENASELLNSKNTARIMSSLKMFYDYIIVDMPPVGSVSDVAAFSKCTDGVIMVVREQHCPSRLLKGCVEQLQIVGVKILGFVLNGSLEGTSKKYYRSYRSYKKEHRGYGYGYGGYGYYDSYGKDK